MAMERLMGMVLVLVAVQMLLNGLKDSCGANSRLLRSSANDF